MRVQWVQQSGRNIENVYTSPVSEKITLELDTTQRQERMPDSF